MYLKKMRYLVHNFSLTLCLSVLVFLLGGKLGGMEGKDFVLFFFQYHLRIRMTLLLEYFGNYGVNNDGKVFT